MSPIVKSLDMPVTRRTRLQRWKDQRRLLTPLGGDQNDAARLSERQAAAFKSGDLGSGPRFTTLGLIESCKELIFNRRHGKPLFHAIAYSFNASLAVIELAHQFDLLVDEDDPSESIRNTLALAAGVDVPVYPNTERLADELAQHHKEMLIRGFFAPDEEGKPVHLKLVSSPGAKVSDPHYLNEILISETHAPAELALIRSAVRSELDRWKAAGIALASLTLAISSLDRLLKASRRNEHELQRCLTDHPVLFGAEYLKVIPKHRLGSEFEMDYALQHVSGTYDLVEIESSALSLFTQGGNPTQYLVRAEQQVLDWLDWIERNQSYAQRNLPGVIAPRGFVIIGRTESLSGEERHKLQRRNAAFRGQVRVLTYDDLKEGATNLLRLLGGQPKVAP